MRPYYKKFILMGTYMILGVSVHSLNIKPSTLCQRPIFYPTLSSDISPMNCRHLAICTETVADLLSHPSPEVGADRKIRYL